MKLTSKEFATLREIVEWPGKYSSKWTPKTNLRLESKGLVEVFTDCVVPTAEGKRLVKEG